MRAIRPFAAALLLALSACAASQDDEIAIGLAAPVSIPFGKALEYGAEMAIDEINAALGINGRLLKLEIRDDQMDRERAIEVATEFRDSTNVVAVIGHVNSAATLAAADIYNHPVNGLLEISPGATSPQLSGKGEWTFRVLPSDLQQGEALAQLAIERLDRQRAAVLYVNDEYGRGVLDAFVSAYEKLGGTVIAQDPFLYSFMESETALDPYLLRAMDRGMDALVIVGVGDEALYILRTARRLGYTGAVMGADGITDLKDAGPIANGVYITTGFISDRPTPEAQEFVRHYIEHYGEIPRDGAAHAYDAVKLIAKAIEKVGPDRRALRDYIAAVGSGEEPFDGVTGTIRFDRNGDVIDKELAIGVIEDGAIVTVR